MLSEAAVNDIKDIRKRYATARSCIMPCLYVIQREYGYITEDGMREIAKILGVKPVLVFEVSTFYTMYNKKPVGRYHVQVCTNISCSIMDGEHIVDVISRKLGVKVKETTPDKKFTLSTVECLGSCGTAPMMQINDKYYENLNDTKVEEILNSLR